jgi:Phasin protein
MLSADENENKPIGKPERKAKTAQSGKKAEPRKRKEGQQRAEKKDQLLQALERASAQVEEQVSEPVAELTAEPVMSTVSSATETPLPEMSPIPAAAPAEAAPVEATPVSLQTIANAYGDYSKKSFEQTSAFVTKLAGARSLANALELQTAFAREAYETFVTESCRIRKLHSELAKQRFGSLEGFVSRMTGTTRNT